MKVIDGNKFTRTVRVIFEQDDIHKLMIDKAIRQVDTGNDRITSRAYITNEEVCGQPCKVGTVEITVEMVPESA